MSSDVYRRVGRGGAGNFVTEKEIEAASKTRSEDLEAQKPSDQLVADTTQQGVSSFSRAGRGGAGNFVDSATRTEAERQERERAEQAKVRIQASLSKSKPVVIGRGGAGNWNDSAAKSTQKAEEEEEHRKADAVRARVLEDVEAGLQPPAPVHHQPERVTS